MGTFFIVLFEVNHDRFMLQIYLELDWKQQFWCSASWTHFRDFYDVCLGFIICTEGFLLIFVIYRLFTSKILNKQTLFAESMVHLILYKLVIGIVGRELIAEPRKSLMTLWASSSVTFPFHIFNRYVWKIFSNWRLNACLQRQWIRSINPKYQKISL